jgi:flagellar biosynthesis protein FlhA
MDILLSISITIGVMVLMTVLFVEKALDFNSFPSVLLMVTMLRLALNISSTRLILSEGHLGTAAAGHVIEAFGVFVMQGSIVIGAIVFGILTVINFVVITKGSGRIAEVAARFSLDAMPGKQMAIDADLGAGLINEATAKTRRKELEDESAFFGSMDGANKFVRGDAVAGLIIIFINLIGGIIIGVVQKDMNFDSAVKTYTLLTIGDGLVTQIPALIVSTAAGLLMTRSGATGSTEKAIFKQLGRFPQAIAITSVVLFAMALIPNIPTFPFMLVATLTSALAYTLYSGQKATNKAAAASQQDSKLAKTQEEILGEILQIDILRLELGYELLPLINYTRGHKLTDQIKALRKQMAKDLGMVIPPVRIQDNLQLDARSYNIKIKDIVCGDGQIEPSKLLVMESRGQEIELPGHDTTEPTFGLKARWIEEGLKESAHFKGYTVVDPPTVIITHLTEIIRQNITELLSASDTQKLIDGLTVEHKKLLSDLMPNQITLTTVQRILQGLLSEGISIRDLPTIIEAIAENVPSTGSSAHNVMGLIENIRARLSLQICNMYKNEQGYLPLVVLTPQWEQAFAESLITTNEGKQLSMAPSQLEEFVTLVNSAYETILLKGESPVLLVSAAIRPYVRSVIERFKTSLPVISQNEVHPKAKIKTLGQI